MKSQRVKRRLTKLLIGSLIATLMLPVAPAGAATKKPDTGSEAPVLFTVPATDARTVRPDTKIQLQLDLTSKQGAEWNRRLQGNVTLTLLNDGGETTFSSALDSELQYDASKGLVTFTPPELLNRNTTYGVVVAAGKPPKDRWDEDRGDQGNHRLPQQPQPRVTEVDEASLLKSQEVALSAAGSLPPIVQRTDRVAPQPNFSAPALQELQAKRDAALANLQAAHSAVRVGPKPVQATDGANHEIDPKFGQNQKGMIKSVEGSVVTLFGGKQFTVDGDTHIQIPGPGKSTLADLHPGQTVTVTVNARGHVQNVIVKKYEGVYYSFVFKTGSALHEPTQVRVEQGDDHPSVTDGGTFTLVSTDDYGLPAWGSATEITLDSIDGTPLHESATVAPNSFTTAAQDGRTQVTVTDRRPQILQANVSMNGPYLDGADSHGFVVTFNFRPGLAHTATLQAPAAMGAGTVAQVTGTVTDLYGNTVEEGTQLNFSATAGTVNSPVAVHDGAFSTLFTAPTQKGDVTLALKSATGDAAAQTLVRVLADVPANINLQLPASVAAGESTLLKGTVTDRFGNLVEDGSRLIWTASAGTLAAETVTAGGAFELPYTAPTHTQTVQVATVSAEGTGHAEGLIEIVAGAPAQLTLQARETSLLTGQTTELGGQVADQFGNLIDKQTVDLQAEHGTVTPAAAASNAQGLYQSTYTAPFYNGLDRVTATAGTVHAFTDLTISSAGSGVNPSTGEVEPVASLVFEPATYDVAAGQSAVLTGKALNADGQALQNVVLAAANATAGEIAGTSYATDANGAFTVTYRAGSAPGAATVTVSSGALSGQATVNVRSYGFGYNPQTGQWEPVGRIEFESARTKPALNLEYSLTLNPSTVVELAGHVYSSSGAALTQVQFDRLHATDGQLAPVVSMGADGRFSVTYSTPNTLTNAMVQIGSGNALTTLNVVTQPKEGYGYNQVTKAWEPVHDIVFNPSEYNVYAGSTVTLTGTVRNAAGQPLTNAKIQLTATGGVAPTQVISVLGGSISVTYGAPTQAGTYTVTASVTNDTYGTVKGDARIIVLPPRPANWESARIYTKPKSDLTGEASHGVGQYYIAYIGWEGRALGGDGLPLFEEFFVLNQGGLDIINPLDEVYCDDDGNVVGNEVKLIAAYTKYTISGRTITYYASVPLTMARFDLDAFEFTDPSYSTTLNFTWTAAR
jgi:protocatechuate 3,4-dioxygenase beta subunit